MKEAIGRIDWGIGHRSWASPMNSLLANGARSAVVSHQHGAGMMVKSGPIGAGWECVLSMS